MALAKAVAVDPCPLGLPQMSTISLIWPSLGLDTV